MKQFLWIVFQLAVAGTVVWFTQTIAYDAGGHNFYAVVFMVVGITAIATGIVSAMGRLLAFLWRALTGANAAKAHQPDEGRAQLPVSPRIGHASKFAPRIRVGE